MLLISQRITQCIICIQEACLGWLLGQALSILALILWILFIYKSPFKLLMLLLVKNSLFFSVFISLNPFLFDSPALKGKSESSLILKNRSIVKILQIWYRINQSFSVVANLLADGIILQIENSQGFHSFQYLNESLYVLQINLVALNIQTRHFI